MSLQETATIDSTLKISDNFLDWFGKTGNLTADTVSAMAGVTHEITVPDGGLVIREGETGQRFYVIKSGVIEVFRDLGDGVEGSLICLGVGDTLGEMALLDEAPRSASARAKGEAKVLEFCPEELESLPQGAEILRQIRGAMGVIVARRIRRTTDTTVDALKRELAMARERQQFGQFFLYIMLLIAIMMLVSGLISQRLFDIDPTGPEFVWGYIALLSIPGGLYMWRTKVPLADVGLSTDGFWRSLKEGAILSAGLGGVFWVLSIYLTRKGLIPGQSAPFDFFGALGYLLHSFLQELFGRGFLQTSLQKFINDKKGYPTIICGSLFFGLAHIHLGLEGVGLTIVGSIIFGFIYQRHKNLAGVTLVHFMIGVFVFSFGYLP
ncbi:MAG: cyclic nucleotide-binding domain-containing protein [Rhodospirillum sp.]|nr:cyclic nucleotide-binding domain-containing protein [Rhodospirillum sp.]MCF8490622.1 cyclic nucleotide-binding domain-containing protein [Rhodospirillum sp.]MCF8498931.1 cyclic nucleotide-binding domain-containing protein [Rhodospirillum sp.]